MASKIPSTSSSSEIKESVDYALNEKASGTCDDEKGTCDDEKAVDGEGSFTKEGWNSPSVNKYRLCSCFVLFIAGSLFFSSFGVIIPEFERDYGRSHTEVSLIFVGPFVGAVVAAATTNKTHLSLGRGGAGTIASIFMGLGSLFLALHPPWPVVPVVICLVSFGVAGLDPVASAWVGSLHYASGFLGVLQGCFGIGSTIAPLTANAVIQRGIPYYQYYYIPFALSILGGIGFMMSFWDENGAKYIQDTSSAHKPGLGHTKEILRNKVSWILALFMLLNWGAETTIGSWMVIYLTDARGGSSSNASLINSMFWLSLTIGSLVLPWVIGAIPPEWRGKGPVSFFISASFMWELMYWLLPTFVGSSVALCLLGFFFGALYPLTLRVLTKLLPSHLHVTAIGIGSALGAAGNLIFPTIGGAIADHRGIAMIHPLILGIYAVELALWHCLPAMPSEAMSS